MGPRMESLVVFLKRNNSSALKMARKFISQTILRKTFKRACESCDKAKSIITLRPVTEGCSDEGHNGYDA